jgi:hypothetical protein
MFDALNTTVGALQKTGTRILNDASSIVNASSTGATGDLSSSLVKLQTDKTGYAAQAKVVQAVNEDNKRLLDILA